MTSYSSPQGPQFWICWKDLRAALNESGYVLANDKYPAGWRANFYPTGLNDLVVCVRVRAERPA